jgi:FkbM family methyltransferase
MYGWGFVIAIEAQERIYYALAGNIAINNCFNASAIFAAAGAKSGSIDVPEPNYGETGSYGSLELRKRADNEYIGQEIDYGHTRPIRMMRIDELQLPRCDFLKIDVEGMEGEVLSGARETIAQHKPIMLIEMIKCGQMAIIAELDRHGYDYRPEGINMLAVHPDDVSLKI